MNYGIPYQGSKNSIAKDIINKLPPGKRFVDLFGGGFSMSHCALLSNKYEEVLYNDLNPLLEPMIKKAIKGDYSYINFKPEYIDREKFHKLKNKDGYIKYIWSFSNSGREYLFGKDLEDKKKSIHNWVVFNQKDEWFNKYFYDIDKYIKTKNIKARRILWKRYIEIIKKKKDDRRRLQQLQQLERLANLQQLQQLERLANLQQLQQLERLANLQFSCNDYKKYEYKDGDIVYLDPPYENTASYDKQQFNHKEFYEWVATRPYKVYFSSYNNISDNRFKMIWAENKRSLMAGAGQKKNYECLYTNIIGGTI